MEHRSITLLKHRIGVEHPVLILRHELGEFINNRKRIRSIPIVLHQKLLTKMQPATPAIEAPESTIETYDRNRHKTDEHYVLVQDRAGLDALVDALASVPLFSFDTETTGLDKIDARPIGMSFGLAPGKAFYVPLLDRDRKSVV